ncbi:hypothetical protein NPIL_617151 [Nephila pilipes]|uniref:Uncharacterized protein n=1 Tax=Nephila pilipes TaxID=299642 RepID=A0A8X6P619_NEPPI|nr:hypothetical protein NPIL_617151 [Nephila pilipes]
MRFISFWIQVIQRVILVHISNLKDGNVIIAGSEVGPSASEVFTCLDTAPKWISFSMTISSYLPSRDFVIRLSVAKIHDYGSQHKIILDGVVPDSTCRILLLDWRVFVSLHVISNAERSSSFSVLVRQKVVKTRRVKLGISFISFLLSQARGPPYN